MSALHGGTGSAVSTLGSWQYDGGVLCPSICSRNAVLLLPLPQVRINIMGAEVGYFHHIHKGVDWVFVDHPSYPRPGGLYADEHGVYGDNQVGQAWSHMCKCA